MVGRAPQRRIMSQKTKPEKRKAYRKKESRLGTTELINQSINRYCFIYIHFTVIQFTSRYLFTV